MGAALVKELHSLLAYYGENPDSPNAPKPEDFFGLIASFSSSLQVMKLVSMSSRLLSYCVLPQKCALEVHDAEAKLQKSLPIPKLAVEEAPEKKSDAVSMLFRAVFWCIYASLQTIKAQENGGKGNVLQALGSGSVGRGDLDHAIRSMREGKRRPRQARPLSKIFLDGGTISGRPHSRMFD